MNPWFDIRSASPFPEQQRSEEKYNLSESAVELGLSMKTLRGVVIK
jgi:hypothetical protein